MSFTKLVPATKTCHTILSPPSSMCNPAHVSYPIKPARTCPRPPVCLCLPCQAVSTTACKVLGAVQTAGEARTPCRRGGKRASCSKTSALVSLGLPGHRLPGKRKRGDSCHPTGSCWQALENQLLARPVISVLCPSFPQLKGPPFIFPRDSGQERTLLLSLCSAWHADLSWGLCGLL